METRGVIRQISRIREATNLLIDREIKSRSMKGILPAHGPLLLFLLKQEKPVPMKSIVDSIGRVKSTVTVMINTLEKHGYLKRSASETDSRVTLIELTTEGRKVKKDFEEISQMILHKVYGDMDQEKREELVKLLNQIEQNLI